MLRPLASRETSIVDVAPAAPGDESVASRSLCTTAIRCRNSFSTGVRSKIGRLAKELALGELNAAAYARPAVGGASHKSSKFI